jgi:hypothetical protein
MITEPVNVETKNARWFNYNEIEINVMDIEFTDKLISNLESLNHEVVA